MIKKLKVQISWIRFYEQHKADIKLWCYFILFQQLCRLCFILAFVHHLSLETKITTILYAMANGLRFDSVWATCWLFIPLICFTLPSLFLESPNKSTNIKKHRQYLGGVFTIITAIMYIASIEYFREYKDVFNHFLFGWFYDDKVAILKTIYANHHVIFYFFLLITIVFLYIKFSRFFAYKTSRSYLSHYSVTRKAILSTTFALFYVVGFRGSIVHLPTQQKDADVTADSFLNKTVVSPYSSLKYAIDDHKYIENINSNINISADNAQKIAQKFFNTDKLYPTFTRYTEKRSIGSKLPSPPKHIFVIVGESLDSWPLQDQYKEFNLTPNLHKIIKKSTYFKYFLSCAPITIGTLSTIITGIPDANSHINYQKRTYSTLYPTAIATQFKKLGYKPQFFYGGFLSWERIGDFATAQGFEVIYGPAYFDRFRQQTNFWGVNDRVLFDFIIATIKDAKTPTFNLIMTTSNHPPYSIDLKKEGFHAEKTAKLLLNKYPTTSISIKELGHIWYNDKAIGEFIDKMSTIDNTALFIITGDHYGRKHILNNPPLYDTASVPLIIYSPKIKKHYDTNLIAGGHLDLGATLIELIAPKGFTYYAMGNNLLAKGKFNFGIGHDRVITPNFIASIVNSDIMYFKKTKDSTISTLVDVLKEKFHQATYITHYIIKKGVAF